MPVMDLRNASHVILDCFCLARQQPALHVNEQRLHKHPQIIFATCYRHSDLEIPTLVRDPRRALQFLRCYKRNWAAMCAVSVLSFPLGTFRTSERNDASGDPVVVMLFRT